MVIGNRYSVIGGRRLQLNTVAGRTWSLIFEHYRIPITDHRILLSSAHHLSALLTLPLSLNRDMLDILMLPGMFQFMLNMLFLFSGSFILQNEVSCECIFRGAERPDVYMVNAFHAFHFHRDGFDFIGVDAFRNAIEGKS